MCYSAMVEQDAKKLGIRFMAKIQRDYYDDLFSRRLHGEKLSINKAMEMSFLQSEDADDKAIADKIKRWHAHEVSRIEEGLFAQKKRWADAQRVLKGGKLTKKAENDQRIAIDKIEKFKRDLEKHHDLASLSDSDQRIYPQHYLSMLALNEAGEKVIMPVRYHMRPANKDESFDRQYNGCYNARLDSIDRVPWWRNVLGKRHGLILVRRFFENVLTEKYLKSFKLDKASAAKKTIVLCFAPDHVEYIFIPMLWDVWKKEGEPTLFSGAVITDDPAPEIAEAGHDRTPIFLKESAIEPWLCARGSAKEIKEVLGEREYPHYSHRVLSAA